MKHLLLIVTLLSVCACGGGDATSEPADKDSNNSTELRDWAKSHTSRAEITTQLAEAKMALRLVEQTDPQSGEVKELKAKIKQLEEELEGLKNSARQ